MTPKVKTYVPGVGQVVHLAQPLFEAAAKYASEHGVTINTLIVHALATYLFTQQQEEKAE